MSDVIKYREKMREKAGNMGDEELAAYVSRNMMKIEEALVVAAERLDAAAGDDRYCQAAIDMLTVKRAEYAIRGAHADLSLAQATAISAPIARAGER